MICEPCRTPHQPQDCVDEQPSPRRIYPYRHCACQHHPPDLRGPAGGEDDPDPSEQPEPDDASRHVTPS